MELILEVLALTFLKKFTDNFELYSDDLESMENVNVVNLKQFYDCGGIEVFDEVKIKFKHNSDILESAVRIDNKYFVLELDNAADHKQEDINLYLKASKFEIWDD